MCVFVRFKYEENKKKPRPNYIKGNKIKNIIIFGSKSFIYVYEDVKKYTQ